VYSQEKLLLYALAFDGVTSGVIRGRIRETGVFIFVSVSSSSDDAIVGMLSFRMFMLMPTVGRLGLSNNNKFKLLKQMAHNSYEVPSFFDSECVSQL
jgi:hypothetical protein